MVSTSITLILMSVKLFSNMTDWLNFVDTRSVGHGLMKMFMRNDNERMKDCLGT